MNTEKEMNEVFEKKAHESVVLVSKMEDNLFI